MENRFLVDSAYLSEEALNRKHRLESDPAARKDPMEYLPGMEQIDSDVCRKVLEQMENYDYMVYTAKDVKAALEHDTCSIEDFKALLSPAAAPFLEQMAQRARLETGRHFGNTVYLFTPLYIANYCENYCVYCGFNCYNHIKRMKLTMEQIEHEIKGALVEKSYACIYLQQVIRAIGNTCQSLSDDPEKIIAQREKLLKEVSQAKTFDKAVTLVKEYADGVFESLQDLNSSSSQRQGMMAMDYIRKNYMDQDLSLNSICSYLNISTSYFSTIFKEMTGETFIESLTRIRMEKARELLENTTLKNYEIAEKVGFSDPHYFGISFKKMTGKTPTEYAREKRR